MKKYYLFLGFAVAAFSFGCKKGPGEGGQTSIIGKVWEQKFFGSIHNTDTLDHWATEQDIYIIYGSELSYGNRTKAGPEGLYEFQYLRAGDYTVYFYSDSTLNLKKVIKRVVKIPDSGRVDLGTDTIKKIF